MENKAIQRFIDKIRIASRSKGRTINLTIEEAQDVANELALFLLQENKLLREINELKDASMVTEVTIGGGSFK